MTSNRKLREWRSGLGHKHLTIETVSQYPDRRLEFPDRPLDIRRSTLLPFRVSNFSAKDFVADALQQLLLLLFLAIDGSPGEVNPHAIAW